MGFLGIVRIAIAYKLVSIVGTELHRYIKHKMFTKHTKNNSMNRWEYYLENKLLKNYAKYLESFGDVKLVPDFNVSGPVANVPNQCAIKVYDGDDKELATIECETKPVIKKSLNAHYIDIEIAKFKITPKNKNVENRQKRNMAPINSDDSETLTEDASIVKRVGNIIKNTRKKS